MTADELYEALDKLGVEYDVVEVFDGIAQHCGASRQTLLAPLVRV